MRPRSIWLLVALALGLLAAPLAADAQQPAGKVSRIAWLVFAPPSPEGLKVFLAAMRERGWTEGRNLAVQIRVGRLEEAEDLARKVIAEGIDVLLTPTTSMAIAVRRVTHTVPIVMVASGYPVEVGLAASLRRPGGNVTGNTIYAGVEIWGKYLELLREAVPGMTRLGVLWDYAPPAFPDGPIALDELQRAARTLGISVRLHLVRRQEDLDRALTALGVEDVHALFVTSNGVHFPVRARIAEFALRRRLPTLTDYSWPEPDTLLFAYSPSLEDLFRGTARFVDRILRGASPGDLPIEQPARFEFIINRRTAKALGLTLPPSILVRADKVIE